MSEDGWPRKALLKLTSEQKNKSQPVFHISRLVKPLVNLKSRNEFCMSKEYKGSQCGWRIMRKGDKCEMGQKGR